MLERELKRGRSLLVRLDQDADIIGQIGALAHGKNISTGIFFALGALKEAEIAFYDQESLEYKEFIVDRPTELVSCSGNISTRDGKPFVHAHAVLADPTGRTTGGHLLHGKIFAAELFLVELLGRPMIREHDSSTDLYLWSDQ